MSDSPSSLGFPRRIVAYYLLIALAVVCWLSVAGWLVSHKVVHSLTTDACLSGLDRTVSAIEIAYLRSDSTELQHQVEMLAERGFVDYVAIVDTQDNVLAHTQVSLVGTEATTPQGDPIHWGVLQGVRFEDLQRRTLQEYQWPLSAGAETIGTLRVALVEPSLPATLKTIEDFAPLVLAIPLLVVALGARKLYWLTVNQSEIESQLRSLAVAQPQGAICPQKLQARTGAAIGWNRLVDTVQTLREKSQQGGLQQRLEETATARSKQHLAGILQNLSDGVALTDAEGRITFANRAIESLLGADEEQPLEGSSLDERLLSEMPSLSECPLLDPESNHRQVVSEASRSQGESQRVLRVSRQPLLDASQSGTVWSVRDVTQQKLADKMRDQFIDTATHELRTPLSNIKAYAEMLATSEKLDVEHQKEFCNTINSEVTRLARFVDDLLSLSSMEVGSLTAEKQKVETARMFEEVLTKVQPLMDQKNILFEVRLPEKMDDLVLDKEKMVAVLVNLLGNASKYTPAGGHVALKVKIEDGELEISVEDTGLGISAEELPLVFDKFFRSVDARVQEETGTGLGLSLAREVVRMHGGEITVESEIDKGSTFVVTIPLE